MSAVPVAPVEPDLAEGYRRCAELTRRHGTTYYWGAAILPKQQRRHVHAVYALCRLADDIVDAPGATDPGRVAATEQALADFQAAFLRAVEEGTSPDPVLAAVGRTVRETRIDPECFERFFGAMAQDLTTTEYATWEDLLGYMEGSAAVIGEMMLPVLEPSSAAAKQPARALGNAFQLTNFLRDIAEDLDRGRQYVPLEDTRRFGTDLASRQVTPEFVELMRFEIDRCRALYASADLGIAMLPDRSARCVRAAHTLYGRILDRIEQQDHDVFATRATVSTAEKARVVASLLRP